MNKFVISAAEEEKLKKKSRGEIWEKIIDIRNRHGLGRDLFAKEIDTSGNTLKAMEKRGSNPSTKIVQNICRRWPEYTLWLLIDETNIEVGQISPQMKTAIGAKEVFDRSNKKQIKLIREKHKQLTDLMSTNGSYEFDSESVAIKNRKG